MRRLALCSLLLVIAWCAWSQEDKPLTHAAALSLVDMWGPDVTADKIVVLDWLLRQNPLVTMPALVTALKGADLALGWDPQYVSVSLASPFPDKPPPIAFRIPLADREVKGFVPGRSPWPLVAGILAASLVGVVSDELLPLPPFAKQAAAVALGALAGAGALLLVP